MGRDGHHPPVTVGVPVLAVVAVVAGRPCPGQRGPRVASLLVVLRIPIPWGHPDATPRQCRCRWRRKPRTTPRRQAPIIENLDTMTADAPFVPRFRFFCDWGRRTRPPEPATAPAPEVAPTDKTEAAAAPEVPPADNAAPSETTPVDDEAHIHGLVIAQHSAGPVYKRYAKHRRPLPAAEPPIDRTRGGRSVRPGIVERGHARGGHPPPQPSDARGTHVRSAPSDAQGPPPRPSPARRSATPPVRP